MFNILRFAGVPRFAYYARVLPPSVTAPAFSDADERAIKDPVIAQFEEQGHPLYASARARIETAGKFDVLPRLIRW